MGNQDNVFIIQIHQAANGGQEFGSHLIPCAEGIIRFMGDTHFLVHVQAASLIHIFQQINHNGLEIVLLLFKFVNDFLENLPCQGSLGHAPGNFHFILDRDEGGIHKLDVTIRVQHDGVRESVGKEGLAAEGRTIQPHNTLGHGVQVTAFILGKNHVIQSFLTKILIFTPVAKVIGILGVFIRFNQGLCTHEEFNHFVGVIGHGQEFNIQF